MQIIAKRGNTLWVPVSNTQIDSSMLIGIDQAKCSGNKFNLSICATIDPTYTSIFSKNILFFGNEGKFQAMIALTLNSISNYINRNKSLPK